MSKLVTHGGELRAFAEQFRIHEKDILDFSSNVNPLGVSETVRRAYLESASELSRYPDPHAHALCLEIARHCNVPVRHVVAGNGSMEILATAFRVLALKRILLVEPSFAEYRRLAQLTGAEIRTVKLSAKNNFEFSLDALFQKIKDIDLLVLGHPNNPTGTALETQALETLLRHCRREGVRVILDEAFADWCPEISRVTHLAPHVLVVRSLTKFYALAGIRSGFGIGPARWIEAIKRAQGPWTVNRIAQKISVAALRDEKSQAQTRAWFEKESVWFYESLSQLPFLKVFPSRANFFLVQMPDAFDFLGQKGIYVRRAGNFHGLNKTFFRVAIKTRTENEKLIKLLQNFLRHPERSEGSAVAQKQILRFAQNDRQKTHA